MIKINKFFLFNFSVVLLVYFLSLVLLNYYTNGDQEHYIRAYEGLADRNLLEGFLFYNGALSSGEFVHFILSWILSGHVEKNIFIATSNAILAYFTSKLLIKWNVNLLVIFSIVVLNFYFIVLYTGAERLKFGVLFMIISFYYFEHTKRFILFSIIAVLAHTQILIVYLSMIFYFYSNQLFIVMNYQKIKKIALYILVLSILIFVVIYDQLIKKFLGYLDIKPITELFQWFVLLIMSLYYSKDRSQTFMVFLALAVVILLVGGMRVNMLAYLAFLYYGLQYNRGVNIGVISMSMYFFVKSIPFVYAIFEHGNGFSDNALF